MSCRHLPERQSSAGGPKNSIACQFFLLTSTSFVMLLRAGLKQYSSVEQLVLQYPDEVSRVRLAGKHTSFCNHKRGGVQLCIEGNLVSFNILSMQHEAADFQQPLHQMNM